jgi:hypothetical protein
MTTSPHSTAGRRWISSKRTHFGPLLPLTKPMPTGNLTPCPVAFWPAGRSVCPRIGILGHEDRRLAERTQFQAVVSGLLWGSVLGRRLMVMDLAEQIPAVMGKRQHDGALSRTILTSGTESPVSCAVV